MSNALPEISVILPTYNRPSLLCKCLESLREQTFPPDRFEVIVVDDGSTQETEAVVREFIGGSQFRIEYIRTSHGGPGSARNAGADRAHGEVLAFIEDDVVADERWLEHASVYFATHNVSGVEGKTVIQGSSGQIRVLEEEEQLSFIPCNFFLKKKVFEEVGGYDPDFFDSQTQLYFREDADLGFRLLERRHVVGKVKEVIVKHPVQFSSARDAFKHCRRFYFDPLLYQKDPKSFRKFLEVKKLRFIHIHRPFHYLCLFHILFFLLILFAVAVNTVSVLIVVSVLFLIVHTAIRFRYERSYIPKVWNILDTGMYLVLPFHYMIWVLCGCKKFRSWGCLL